MYNLASDLFRQSQLVVNFTKSNFNSDLRLQLYKNRD